MVLDQFALLELFGELKLTEVADRIRAATEALYQELIEAEAAVFIGAAPFERTSARTRQRNGSRPGTLTTTVGDLQLRIPKLRQGRVFPSLLERRRRGRVRGRVGDVQLGIGKLRQGRFFPSLLERRRRVDQALFAVVMEAYVHGVWTRKLDDLVKALGADTGISTSEVSRICANLDEDLAAFRDRSLDDATYPYVFLDATYPYVFLDATYPYVFLDATYCKARIGRPVVSQAAVVGVAADRRSEGLGFEVGETESQPFWTTFLRSLKARGLDRGEAHHLATLTAG